MRGVDLNVFDFDFDLTWMAFLMNADEIIYDRFGGRGADGADKYLTLSGLKQAMRAALEQHQKHSQDKSAAAAKPELTVEQYPAAKRLKAGACIHCHQVYDFRREEKKADKQWKLDDVWVYPLPQNLGVDLAPAQGNKVQFVAKDSAASRAGLHDGDEIRTINGAPVASFADIQYALQKAPPQGSIAMTWQNNGESKSGRLDLTEGWRKTDISWRTSMWGLDPAPYVHGQDLGAEEKKKLGLPEKALAFRQGPFVPPFAKMAGVQQGDVIVGIDGKVLEMTMRQFNAYVRTTYHVGDHVKLNVIRGGQRIEIPMTLTGRS
jgi:predicted metalloprotease with PDZ domain